MRCIDLHCGHTHMFAAEEGAERAVKRPTDSVIIHWAPRRAGVDEEMLLV